MKTILGFLFLSILSLSCGKNTLDATSKTASLSSDLRSSPVSDSNSITKTSASGKQISSDYLKLVCKNEGVSFNEVSKSCTCRQRAKGRAVVLSFAEFIPATILPSIGGNAII